MPNIKSKKELEDYLERDPSNILSLLLEAYYQVDKSLLKTLSNRGWQELTHSQSMIFLNMGEGRTRIIDIANHIGVSKQAVSRTVNELVEMGMIELVTAKQDKRSRILTLTEKGAIISKDASDSIKTLERKIVAKLGENEAQTLKTLLAELGKDKFEV